MKFLDVMFGDRPALTPHELAYQRMLARDPIEVRTDRLVIFDKLPVILH